MTAAFKIGTRGSKLALVQTRMVEGLLAKAHPGLSSAIVEIHTSGDWKPEQGETRLSEAEGGKGLFAREIERAILDGVVDCGVHSLKDMPSFLPEGLVIRHVLEREDPRDAFLSVKYKSLAEMPSGATIGTSSLRRQAFIMAKRPDLKVIPLRGNVPTRIDKMKAGQADAIILACAGLKRLGLMSEVRYIFSPEEFLPGAAQGAIGIEIRSRDEKTAALLNALNHDETVMSVSAERAALQVLDGSCHTPIGAYAIREGKELHLRVAVASADGKQFFTDEARSKTLTLAEAETLGQVVGLRLKARVPPELLAA